MADLHKGATKKEAESDLDAFMDKWDAQAQRVARGVGTIPVENEDIPDEPEVIGTADPIVQRGDPQTQWGPWGCPWEPHRCWDWKCKSNDGTMLTDLEKAKHAAMRDALPEGEGPEPIVDAGKLTVEPDIDNSMSVPVTHGMPHEDVVMLRELLSSKETTTFVEARDVRRMFNEMVRLQGIVNALVEEQGNILQENNKLRRDSKVTYTTLDKYGEDDVGF